MVNQYKIDLSRYLLGLWEEHDKLEREIIAVSKEFTDKELEELHETGQLIAGLGVRVPESTDPGNTRPVPSLSASEIGI